MTSTINCLPIEYCNNNKNVKNIINSIPNQNNIFSIWNNDNFFVADNNYEKIKFVPKLNQEFCERDIDNDDFKKEVILLYKSKYKLKLDENKYGIIQNILSQRVVLRKILQFKSCR